MALNSVSVFSDPRNVFGRMPELVTLTRFEGIQMADLVRRSAERRISNLLSK